MGINKVIVQFKTDAPNDLGRLFQIEDTLHQAFSQSDDGFVDGHDVGQGTFNIFISTREAWGACAHASGEAFLKLRGAYEEAVIVKFHGKTERYQIVHPSPYAREFAL